MRYLHTVTCDVAKNLTQQSYLLGFQMPDGGFKFRIWFGIGLHFGLASVCMLVLQTKNWFACRFSV